MIEKNIFQTNRKALAKILTKDFLINEYSNKKIIISDLAKELGCHEATVYRYLRKYKIQTHLLSGKFSNGNIKKEPYCIDCGTKVSEHSWQYGQGRCKGCASREVLKKFNYLAQYRKKARPMPVCSICGKIKKSRVGKICKPCATRKRYLGVKGDKTSNWKGGKVKIKCFLCKKELMRAKHRLKNKVHSFCSHKCSTKWMSGKNSTTYVHGRGRAPYPLEFNDKLKLKIRERDNYTCQNCGITEEEHIIVFGSNLPIHHIDYDKRNCQENNLITVCKSCNTRANVNRDYWKKYYGDKLCLAQK